MSTVLSQLIDIVEHLIQENPQRKGGLKKLERLAIVSIIQRTTYAEASLKHGYTESSFQNAASRLFKDLSPILGMTVNRKNFEQVVEEAWETMQEAKRQEEIVFDRLQVQVWICEERAKLISLSYDANRILDITDYLVDYSPQFAATFCVDVGEKNSPLELLWNLYQTLQVALPMPKNDPQALLQSIANALKQRKTLLILRFDSLREGSLPLDPNRPVRGEYAEILGAIGLGEGQSCLISIDNDPVADEIQAQQSLSDQLRSEILSQSVSPSALDAGTKSKVALRLISIDNDRQGICELLQTYLR
jgi:hypothetical protein